MDKKQQKKLIKPLTWFTMTGFCLVSLFGAPVIRTSFNHKKSGQYSVNTKAELKHLELLDNISEEDLADLLHLQDTYHLTLPKILRDPEWVNRLGLSSRKFRATWYISNPFDFLPQGLKKAIREKSPPIRTRRELWHWCKIRKFPAHWKEALKAALIETTPENLWRAARGRKPWAHNGEILEPIVIDHGNGMLEVKDGHIAIDPRIISLNSKVILIVKINGVDQILKVRAADIGGAVKGYHVDLPIKVNPNEKQMPHTRLPTEKIGNSSVEILTPGPGTPNPGRKA